MKNPYGSWLALVTFCAITSIAAALGFSFLFAGGSVVFAVAQAAQISNETGPASAGQISPASAETVSADKTALDEPRNAPRSQSQMSPVKEDAPSGKTFSGMLTDSRCGARHSMDSGKTSAECARACVRNGSSYVLVDGEARHTLDGDSAQLEKLAGQRVEVVGMLDGDTIKVVSVGVR